MKQALHIRYNRIAGPTSRFIISFTMSARCFHDIRPANMTVRKTNKRTIVENDEPTYRKWYYELGFVFVFVFGMHRHRYILYSRTVPTKYMYLKYLRVLIKEFLPLNDFTLSCPLIIGLLAVRRAKASTWGRTIVCIFPCQCERTEARTCNAMHSHTLYIQTIWSNCILFGNGIYSFCSVHTIRFGLDLCGLCRGQYCACCCVCVFVYRMRACVRTDQSIAIVERWTRKKQNHTFNEPHANN